MKKIFTLLLVSLSGFQVFSQTVGNTSTIVSDDGIKIDYTTSLNIQTGERKETINLASTSYPRTSLDHSVIVFSGSIEDFEIWLNDVITFSDTASYGDFIIHQNKQRWDLRKFDNSRHTIVNGFFESQHSGVSYFNLGSLNRIKHLFQTWKSSH